MSILDSVSDIKKDVLSICGELTDSTSEYDTAVVEYINQWHRKILAGSTELNIECGDAWFWARAQFPGVVNLIAPYTTGLVAVTSGLATGTFSVPPTIDLSNYWIKIEGKAEYFRLKTTAIGVAAFTLDAAYTDDTTSGSSFTAYKLDYPLTAGILRIASPMRVYRRQAPYADDTGQVDIIDIQALNRDYPLHRMLGGIPDRAAVSYQSNAGDITLRFNRVNYTAVRIEYSYIPYPADLTDSSSSKPLLPLEHRKLLSYGAAYYVMLNKNDTRADEYRELTKTSLEALIQATRRIKANEQKDFGRLIAREDLTHYTRRYYSQEVAQ